MESASYSYRQALTQSQGQAPSQPGLVSEMLQSLKSQHSAGQRGPGEIHPFLKLEGEKLPPGCFRNVDGLLVRGAASFNVLGEDLVVLEQEIRFLTDHVLIARSLAGDLTLESETSWLTTLRQIVSPGTVLGHQRAGPGLFTSGSTAGSLLNGCSPTPCNSFREDK